MSFFPIFPPYACQKCMKFPKDLSHGTNCKANQNETVAQQYHRVQLVNDCLKLGGSND